LQFIFHSFSIHVPFMFHSSSIHLPFHHHVYYPSPALQGLQVRSFWLGTVMAGRWTCLRHFGVNS
jgi:hypothetical protein